MCGAEGLSQPLFFRSDDVSLQPLLSFLVKYVSHPKYSAVLIDVANVTFGRCPRLCFFCRAAPHVARILQICTLRYSAVL